MKAIIKRPGEAPEFIEFDGFNHMKKLIGCEIAERVLLARTPAGLDIVMYVDEEGLCNDSKFNFTMNMDNSYFPIQNIMGTVLFCVTRIVNGNEIFFNTPDLVMDFVKLVMRDSKKEPVKYEKMVYVESL